MAGVVSREACRARGSVSGDQLEAKRTQSGTGAIRLPVAGHMNRSESVKDYENEPRRTLNSSLEC